MKKTLLALAVATVSTSALAAGNIYDDGTTAFNVKGEIDTFLNAGERTTTAYERDKDDNLTGNIVKSKETSDLDVDLWAKIQIDATHKLNDTVTLFGSFEMENGNGYGAFNGKLNDDNTVRTDDLYFGANIGENFGIAAGEIGDFGDSFDAITIDNTNEGFSYMDDFVNSLESKGHAISLKYTTGGLKLIADSYLSHEEDEDVAYGVSAQYAFNEMFTAGATYQDQGNRGRGDDHQIMGVAARMNIANFGAAVNYVFEDIDGADDLETISAALDYQIEKARLYTTFGFTEDDHDGELNYYTLGADYAVSSNLTAFIEYTDVDNDATVKGDEIKYEGDGALAGLYYTF